MSTTKNLKKKCCYKHWKNITKPINGKECSTFERLTITCTFEELTAQYVLDVLAMRQHIFLLEWQQLQFGDLIKNLKVGEVIMVIDFAKNYSHQSTEEPLSAHWVHMQSTMHPVVVYYKCQCRANVTDEIIHFTADLRHDVFAVEEFEKKLQIKASQNEVHF